MKLDRRLRRVTYVTATLGMLALGLAEMNPVYLGLIVCAAIAAWMREKRHSTRLIGPGLPHLIVFGALGYAIIDYFFISQGWILSLAHFLLIVQMMKLLLPKTDRDYAQIYLISLMNVAVAAIVTVNVFFAVTFILYSGTAIWGLILFHFRTELGQSGSIYLPGDGDTVRPSSSVDMRAVVSRRFLCTLVAVVAITWLFNGVFFLFSPRVQAGFIHLNPMGFLSRLVGYSDRVKLGEIGRILQNDTPVMHVWMRTSGGQPITGERSFYWRGSTYQHYDGRQWHRYSPYINPLHVIKHRMLPFEKLRPKTLRSLPSIRQEITLEPLGSRALFTRHGLAAIKCSGLRVVRENLQDDTVQTDRVPHTFTKYTVISAVTTGREVMPRILRRLYSRRQKERVLPEYVRLPPQITDRVKDLAREIAPLDRYPTPFERALRMESYLAQNYTYTLDLEANPNFEPIEDFLFNRKKGHCEYFASSMVILLRALNIPSRLVSGFHGGEWSDVGEYYIVKQSDAHAWVEAYFKERGWMRFDPTPGAARAQLASASTLGPFDRWIDYLRTTWINCVVQYDKDQQSAILEHTRKASRGIRNVVRRGLYGIAGVFKSIFNVLTDVKRLATVEGVLTLLGALAFSTTIVLTLRWVIIRLVHRIRAAFGARRARKLGHVHIAFYHELQRVLKRRGFVRAPGTTPREFAEQVASEIQGVRDALAELTDVFYRIRFGGDTLEPDRERRLRSVIESVRSAPLSPPR